MTRVNSAIHPSELCDQHLVAEYRELPRISTGAMAAWVRGEKPSDMPSTFTLGTGHMRFFYPLGTFCAERFGTIVTEMQRRGFRTTYTVYRTHPDGWNLNHRPTVAERTLLLERIALRMPKKARWSESA